MIIHVALNAAQVEAFQDDRQQCPIHAWLGLAPLLTIHALARNRNDGPDRLMGTAKALLDFARHRTRGNFRKQSAGGHSDDLIPPNRQVGEQTLQDPIKPIDLN